ncbi:MAG: sensor histidine kinase [Clostridium sp.]|uniref:sensor histidine kinase n=1 Tax=Clostridium sp. TaxID=1506 RepID=UPI003D6CB3AA
MLIKLRNKFMLWNMTIISVIVLACFFVIYTTTDSNIQKQNYEKIKSIATKEMLSDGTNTKTVAVIGTTDYYTSFSLLMDNNGNITKAQSSLKLPSDVYKQALQIVNKEGKEIGMVRLLDRRWIYKINKTVQASINADNTIGKTITQKRISFLDVTDSYTVLNELLITFFIVGAVVLVIIFGISFVFANNAIKPISTSLIKQKQFISDASHELKTPVAIINANVDAVLANKEYPLEVIKWTKNILSQTERMENLIKNLLSLAKADEENIKFFLDKINISDVVNEVIIEIEAYLFDKNIDFKEKIESNIIVLGNYEVIKQILLILFDNAMKYTSEKGSVCACLMKSKQGAIFTLENSCKGITEEHLTHIFDRFYRIDKSRTNNGSFGLGLPIAKAGVEKMGGKFFVQSIENESIKFTVVFKKLA